MNASPNPTAGRRRSTIVVSIALVVLAVIGLLPPDAAVAAVAAPTETASPGRVQVRLITGDVGDAQTDDPVFVSLGTSHVTWLDSPANDWERASSRTYDLTLDKVTDVASITQLRVGKASPIHAGPTTIYSNAWCLARVVLLLNGRPVFDQPVPRLAATDRCRWLKGESPFFTWTNAQLRSDKLWKVASMPAMGGLITNADLVSQVVASVGQKLHTEPDLRWSTPGVTVTKLDGQAVHVDLDLAFKMLGPDAEVDIDFDLRFACVVPGPRIKDRRPYWTVTPENQHVYVDSFWLWDALLFTGGVIDWLVGNQIDNRLDLVTTTIPNPIGCSADPWYVQANGDVNLLR